MEDKRKEFFWPSYVDLMTALFIIILVLFILSYKLFSDRQKELKQGKTKIKELVDKNEILLKKSRKFEVMAKQYERIQKIDREIKALESTGTFSYDNIYNRFLVKDFIGKEIFESRKDIIKPEFYEAAFNAGKSILSLINTLYKEEHIRFLILIEGNTANKYDGSYNRDSEYGYNLSYNRALALFKFWKERGIIFNSNTEVIIAGSGFSGIGRDLKEENNKRFLIQIIPKID